MKILLVGDEARMRRLTSFGLAGPSDQLSMIGSCVELGRLPDLRDHDVAILDWDMRGEAAGDMLKRLRQLAPALPFVALTGREARRAAALGAGAVEALLKPVDVDAVRTALSLAVARSSGRRACAQTLFPGLNFSPAGSAPPIDGGIDFVTVSPILRRQLLVAAKAARAAVNVLILGENGTGKTHLARGMHEQSPRRGRPFVTVNCPCLQAQLLESELFGHVRGAFTGAVTDAAGLVAAAEGGTLFLDEIGELPPSLQPKLLRLLQERCYERVGEPRTRLADIRIIAATNRDLAADVSAGRFREDLFYRLNVIAIEIPALRQRPEDIFPMAQQLLAEFTRSSASKLEGFTPEARVALQRHPWPGNLRELRNCIERAVILCEGESVGVDDLPNLISTATPAPQVGDLVTLATLEEAHIRRVVEKTGSFMQAARLLGINKTTLYRRRRRRDEGALPFDENMRAAMTG